MNHQSQTSRDSTPSTWNSRPFGSSSRFGLHPSRQTSSTGLAPAQSLTLTSLSLEAKKTVLRPRAATSSTQLRTRSPRLATCRTRTHSTRELSCARIKKYTRTDMKTTQPTFTACKPSNGLRKTDL